jgi:hypothetical protein
LKDQLKTVIKYKELDHDHFSFQLSDDMSYFEEVIELIEQHNPLPAKLPELPEIPVIDPESIRYQLTLLKNCMWWVKKEQKKDL